MGALDRIPQKHSYSVGYEDAEKIIAYGVHVRRQQRCTIHFLMQDELRQLFKVIRSKRDKALFLVAYRHGPRASEIGLLQRADVDAQQGRIAIHRSKLETTQVYTESSTEILLESYQRALSR
jgi:integrase